MTKYIFSCLSALVIFLLCGCTGQVYRLYDDRKFVLESPGVYRNGEDFVYVNENFITMSFSDASITIINGSECRINYPDGCYWICQRGSCIGGVNPSHGHDSDVASLVKEYNTEEERFGIPDGKEFIYSLLITLIGTFVCGLFVFKPDNIRRMAKWGNAIIPLHREPYEPSDLYISLHYIGLLISFIAFVAYFIALISSFIF
jgi:hypothetical protein